MIPRDASGGQANRSLCTTVIGFEHEKPNTHLRFPHKIAPFRGLKTCERCPRRRLPLSEKRTEDMAASVQEATAPAGGRARRRGITTASRRRQSRAEFLQGLRRARPRGRGARGARQGVRRVAALHGARCTRGARLDDAAEAPPDAAEGA